MVGREPLIGGSVCERAREWTSLRLDAELSALESELLDRHLDACEPCRRFEESLRTTTLALRAARPEEPATPAAAAEVVRRRPLPRRRTALLAAGALTLGALVGSFVDGPGRSVSDEPPRVSFLVEDLNDLRDLTRPTPQRAPAPAPAAPPNLPEGAA